MDEHKDDGWRDSDSEDTGDCDWPDVPPGHEPAMDRILWESLLEPSRNPPDWQTPEVASGQTWDGASLPRQLTQGRVRESIGGAGPGTNSVSTTPRPVRLVNWTTEACDRRWCQLADACDPSLDPRWIATATPGEIVRQGALRKARLLAKRLRQTELSADNPLPKSYFRVPVRAGGVNGVELYLSSVEPSSDSPQPQAVLPIDFHDSNQTQPPPADLRVPDDRREPPLTTDLRKLWPSRLFDVKGSIAASTGSLEGSASQRMPSSDVPWLATVSRSLQLQLGTSEVTMEISGDSLSSDSDEAAAGAEPLTLPDTKRLAESFGPSADWRNFVSISVIACGGQTTSGAAVGLTGSAPGQVLAPLSVANSRTTSTNTEQPVPTTAVGSSECPSALDTRAALLACFAMNPTEANSAIARSRRPAPSRPSFVRLDEPQEPQSLRCPMRPQTVRALLRHGAVILAPVWHTCGCHPASASAARVASLRQCLADNARFAWQTKQPACCSRSSCQLLLGLVDVCQSSESQLVLPRHTVYAHRRQADAATAIATVDRLATAHCVLITTPQVLSALRYVAPSDTIDWLPPEASKSPEATNQSPLASLWSQKILWMPQPTNAIGLQFPAGCLPADTAPPAWSVVFQAAPSGSDCGNAATSVEESMRVGRKSQQLQQLRRIVRMKMQQKVQEHEFVGVACSCCSCCSSSLQAEPGSALRGAAEAADGSAKSNSDPLKRSLYGLLQSLRSCRQTATVAAMTQRQRHRSSGDRQFVSYVERILQESTRQQAALSDLLASLKGAASPPIASQQNASKLATDFEAASPPIASQQNAAKLATDFEAVEEASTKSNFSCSQSDQFYSFHTGTAGLPDNATLASGRRTSFFGSPSDKTNGIGGFGSETVNNNAQGAAGRATPSPASNSGHTSQRRRKHRTYYARCCIVRLEESAALLVHETVSQACSLVASCPMHQDLSDTVASSKSSTAIATALCQSRARLCSLERRVLSRVWRNRPPISKRQLDRLDPTVSSFVWWSLIPRNRQIQLSPDRLATHRRAAASAAPRPNAPFQSEIGVAVTGLLQATVPGRSLTSSSGVDEAAALLDFVEASPRCELEL